MEGNERFAYLLDRYLNDSCTPVEMKEFWQSVSEMQDEDAFKSGLEPLWLAAAGKEQVPAQGWEHTLSRIHKAYHRPRRIGNRKIVHWAVAASVLLALLAGAYFIFNKPTTQIAQTWQQRFKNDVAPGSNKAILTLANGKLIILDSAAPGTLTQQGNAKIVKLDSGRLAYNATGINAEVLYNTITTPKGGQYQIILADGSKAWLNAASSLRYPTVFTGKERNVELTGEGYFEVAHNPKMPFHVRVNGLDVEDLGTHFNINAYDDEAIIKTTLLEGSVKVTKDNFTSLLKPGERAQTDHGNQFSPIVVHSADIEKEMAWKNSLFVFSGDDIQTIMRQVARWYDVEVEFKGMTSDLHFTGIISRNNHVSEVLKMLEGTGRIQFQIGGKRIVVMQ